MNRGTAAWLRSRSSIWHELERDAAKAVRRGQATETALKTVESYRLLARDLATARGLLPGSRTTATLEALYVTLHAAINRPARTGRRTVLSLFRDDVPDVVASLRSTILAIALLLLLSAAAGWWMISTYPDLISLIASERMIDGVEQGKLWTDGLLNIAPSSILSTRIFSNNLVIAIMSFCAGTFFGLGTFYLIGLNGVLLGGMFAFTHRYALDGDLLRFILAHGPVELSVICLAGAAGTAVGESLIRPTLPSRRDSFQHCIARVAPLLAACAVLLLGCGIIEGFISPDPRFSMTTRALIGGGYWILMLALLTGRLFRLRRGPVPGA